MKRFLSILMLLLPIIAEAATYPNYYVTNAAPVLSPQGTNAVVSIISTNHFYATNIYSGGTLLSVVLGTNGAANSVLEWNGTYADWRVVTNLTGNATNVINTAAGTLISIVTNTATLITISADSQTNAAAILAITSPQTNATQILAITAQQTNAAQILAITAQQTNAASILAITAQQTNAAGILAITAQQTNTAQLETDLQIEDRTNANSIITIASPLTNALMPAVTNAAAYQAFLATNNLASQITLFASSDTNTVFFPTNTIVLDGAGDSRANGTFVYVGSGETHFAKVGDPTTIITATYNTKGAFWLAPYIISNTIGDRIYEGSSLGNFPMDWGARSAPRYWETNANTVGAWPVPVGRFILVSSNLSSLAPSNTFTKLNTNSGVTAMYLNVGLSNTLHDSYLTRQLSFPNFGGIGSGPSANIGGMFNYNYGGGSVIAGGHDNTNYGSGNFVGGCRNMFVDLGGGEDAAIASETGYMLNPNGVSVQLGCISSTNMADTAAVQIGVESSTLCSNINDSIRYSIQAAGTRSMLHGSYSAQLGEHQTSVGDYTMAIGTSNVVGAAHSGAFGELWNIGSSKVWAFGTPSAGMIASNTDIVATAPILGQHRLQLENFEFYTNRALTASGPDTFRACGTNQLITMPDCNSCPIGYNIRIMSDNGNGNVIITNATGTQTIRDGVSLSFKMIGVDTVNLVCSGSNWYTLTRARIVWPNAQFSCTTNIAFTTTPRAISFNTIDFNNSQGIELVAGTNSAWGTTSMWITNSGQYEFSPSAVETYDGNHTITFWFKSNLTNIANSATACKGANNTTKVITVPFIVNVTEPTRFEIWAVSDDASGEGFVAQAAGVPVAGVPLSPSIICPIKRISDTRP